MVSLKSFGFLSRFAVPRVSLSEFGFPSRFARVFFGFPSKGLDFSDILQEFPSSFLLKGFCLPSKD